MKKLATTKDYSKYIKSIILWGVIGIIITAAVMMFSDFFKVTAILKNMDLVYLPIIFALAPLNYFFRYIKWNYYLKQINLNLPPAISRSIFCSGLCMTITPGKVGELLKSYLIKEYNGTEISTTAPIIMAERLTDAIAMIILASIGSLSYKYGIVILFTTLIFILVLIYLLVSEKAVIYLEKICKKIPFLYKYFHLIHNFQKSCKLLFKLKSLLYAISIGVISWGFEGFIIFLTLKSFNAEISILGSIFVVSFSSIVGAISTLPGGIGAAEGSIMGVLILVFGLNQNIAAATTIITRFSTLWLGVLIGIISFFTFVFKGWFINFFRILQRKINQDWSIFRFSYAKKNPSTWLYQVLRIIA